jgi:hypothetical protein
MALEQVFAGIVKGYTEKAAGKYSLQQHIDKLERRGVELSNRLAAIADAPRHRERLVHIIAIERWGTRRMQILLGEPALSDESDDYRPDAALDWDALRAEFSATRARTVAVARALQERGTSPTATAPHNGFGALTLRGWLAYLTDHAARESRAIR